jgi:hypothetical protein
MKKLSIDFGDTAAEAKFSASVIAPETLKQGIQGIKNRRDQALCSGIPERLLVPPTKAKSVYQIVNELLQIQVRHAAECGKIVKQLFNIQRDPSSNRYRIALSDNIIKKGFPEIQRINYLAREVLTKYYSNCETTYAKGMKEVLLASPNSSKIIEDKIKAAAARAAASAST